ncbi:MAG: hypothetical protein ACI9LY_002492 [Arenicella sp.]|jgi:hypothetical protein
MLAAKKESKAMQSLFYLSKNSSPKLIYYYVEINSKIS